MLNENFGILFFVKLESVNCDGPRELGRFGFDGKSQPGLLPSFVVWPLVFGRILFGEFTAELETDI